MKKTWLSTLVITATMTLAAASAEARGGGGGSGVLFDVNLYYTSYKTETKDTGGTASVTNNDTNAIYDIKLGMLTGTGLYFGGIYTSRSNSVLNQAGTAGSATGGSVGYFGASGMFIMGHYLVGATDGVYSEGTGIQADVGYKASMGDGWMLGAELTYRTITYKKSTSNAGLDTYKKDEVLPMISIGYIF
jgi:hypothetical protein